MQQCAPVRRTSPDSSSPPRESTHRPEATWVCCCAYQKCTRCASCATLQRASPYQARIAAIEPHGVYVCGLAAKESPAHHPNSACCRGDVTTFTISPSNLHTWRLTKSRDRADSHMFLFLLDSASRPAPSWYLPITQARVVATPRLACRFAAATSRSCCSASRIPTISSKNFATHR